MGLAVIPILRQSDCMMRVPAVHCVSNQALIGRSDFCELVLSDSTYAHTNGQK